MLLIATCISLVAYESTSYSASANCVLSAKTLRNSLVNSVYFGWYSISYMHGVVRDALPLALHAQYVTFTKHVMNGVSSAMTTFQMTSLPAILTALYRSVAGSLVQTYDMLNQTTNDWVSGYQGDFETKYPAAKGLVGKNLADRLVSLTFIALVLSCLFRLTMRCAFGRCDSRCSSSYRYGNADREMGNMKSKSD